MPLFVYSVPCGPMPAETGKVLLTMMVIVTAVWLAIAAVRLLRGLKKNRSFTEEYRDKASKVAMAAFFGDIAGDGTVAYCLLAWSVAAVDGLALLVALAMWLCGVK